MKIYISADIEGVTGINNWDEADISKPEYQYYRERMHQEVIAACEGALQAGAKEIVVRDAHATSKNLQNARLPRQAKLIRGWSGHPYAMVEGLDRSFDACMMIGYHARAGQAGNPLSHTMSTGFEEIRLNGKKMSEFALHALAAELETVPTVFVAGDLTLCEDIKTWNDSIITVATTTHWGKTSQTLDHPDVVCEKIKSSVAKALAPEHRKKCHLTLAKEFTYEVDFKEHQRAYRASFYPGARLIGDRSIELKATNYFDVIRAMGFI